MTDKRAPIRTGTPHDRRIAGSEPLAIPPITLAATADELALPADAPSSQNRPLMAPATRVLIEQFGAFALYADWLPLPTDVVQAPCAARRNQLVVRMAHPDVLEPSFGEQLAEALDTAGVGRAMTAYFLPVVRAAVKRGPNP